MSDYELMRVVVCDAHKDGNMHESVTFYCLNVDEAKKRAEDFFWNNLHMRPTVVEVWTESGGTYEPEVSFECGEHEDCYRSKVLIDVARAQRGWYSGASNV